MLWGKKTKSTRRRSKAMKPPLPTTRQKSREDLQFSNRTSIVLIKKTKNYEEGSKKLASSIGN